MEYRFSQNGQERLFSCHITSATKDSYCEGSVRKSQEQIDQAARRFQHGIRKYRPPSYLRTARREPCCANVVPDHIHLVRSSGWRRGGAEEAGVTSGVFHGLAGDAFKRAGQRPCEQCRCHIYCPSLARPGQVKSLRVQELQKDAAPNAQGRRAARIHRRIRAKLEPS